VVNYDLSLRKELELSDIFNLRSKYLESISLYCGNQLSRQSDFIFREALAPRARISTVGILPPMEFVSILTRVESSAVLAAKNGFLRINSAALP